MIMSQLESFSLCTSLVQTYVEHPHMIPAFPPNPWKHCLHFSHLDLISKIDDFHRLTIKEVVAGYKLHDTYIYRFTADPFNPQVRFLVTSDCTQTLPQRRVLCSCRLEMCESVLRWPARLKKKPRWDFFITNWMMENKITLVSIYLLQ